MKIYIYFGEFYCFNIFLLGHLNKYISKKKLDTPINILTFTDYAKILLLYFKDNPNINIIGKENKLYMSYRRAHHGAPNTGNEDNFKIINTFGKAATDSHLLYTNCWLENTDFFKKWINENNLNKYGDLKGTIYDNPPLPDKSLNSPYSLYEYLFKKFPFKPWEKYNINIKGEIYSLANDLFKICNKKCSTENLTKILCYPSPRKNNYIHIFPRKRKGHWGKGHHSHISLQSWIKICKYLKKNYDKVICCHGHMESFSDDLKNYVDVSTKNIEESIQHFYKADLLISPCSGFVQLAVNCGIENVINIYELNGPRYNYNPFNKKKYYVNILQNWDKFRALTTSIIK